MAKLKGGVAAAKSLSNELLDKYKKHPAMREVLGKLNWD